MIEFATPLFIDVILIVIFITFFSLMCLKSYICNMLNLVAKNIGVFKKMF